MQSIKKIILKVFYRYGLMTAGAPSFRGAYEEKPPEAAVRALQH